jgi:hypothetical protein
MNTKEIHVNDFNNRPGIIVILRRKFQTTKPTHDMVKPEIRFNLLLAYAVALLVELKLYAWFNQITSSAKYNVKYKENQ